MAGAVDDTPQDRFWSGCVGETAVETHYDGRRVRCYADRPANLAAMFRDLAARFSERDAVVSDDLRLSFGELHGRIARIAGGLSAFGVGSGDRVALLLDNGWEFVAALLACNRLGAICVPIGIRQRRAELEFLLNDCGAAVLIHEAALAENVPPSDAIPGLRRRIAVGGVVAGATTLDDLLGCDPMYGGAEIGEEDVAVILYTSGTTGRPKGAMLTHFGIVQSSLAFSRCLSFTEEERALAAIPLSHVSGLVGIFYSALIAGGALVAMRSGYRVPDLLETAARERISYTIMVPALYTLATMQPDLAAYDLSAWRIGCFGGAPMPEATIATLARLLPDLVLVNAYGSTETTSPTTIMPPGLNPSHPDSVGQVVPCGRVEIRSEDGALLQPGETGELWISGPMVVPGYWNRPEADREAFVDGAWRSGDIGTVDADGFVKVFDRLKDMINRAGFKVFSAEVENVLNHHPAIVEAAVVGRPDPVLGERVHAVVRPVEGSALDEASVRAFCAERMADYKVPETVVLTSDPLPRNANGKLQKPALRARLTESDR